MYSPTLAIIIPFYKIKFFKKTLESIARQTNTNFNVYIGDDASPDNPAKLINQFNIHNNIYYHKFSENLGSAGMLVEQWDRCIALAGNEQWFMILADDDYISANFVEVFYKSVRIAQKQNIHLLRFKMRRVDENDSLLIDLEQPHLYPAISYVVDDEMRKRFISISENIFSRQAYESAGFRHYPLAWRTDVMMYLDFTNNTDVLGVNEAFVAVRRSNAQLTRRTDMDTHKNRAMELYCRDLLEEYSDCFTNEMLIRFLKIYNYYQKETQLSKSVGSQLWKLGGPKEFLKYQLRKVLK